MLSYIFSHKINADVKFKYHDNMTSKGHTKIASKVSSLNATTSKDRNL